MRVVKARVDLRGSISDAIPCYGAMRAGERCPISLSDLAGILDVRHAVLVHGRRARGRHRHAVEVEVQLEKVHVTTGTRSARRKVGLVEVMRIPSVAATTGP